MKTSEKIHQLTLLNDLPAALMEEWIHSGEIALRSFQPGQIIHLDGDLCRGMEIILSGRVSVERIDESGNLMIINQFGPDDMIGGNLVFSRNPRYPMTIIAKTGTTLVALEKALIFELCSRHPVFLEQFLRAISDNAMLLGDKIKHYVQRSLRESLTSYLKNMAMIQGSNRIQLPVTKKELAEQIGVQRTSLSRELQKMKQEGLVEYDSRTIRLLKPL
jgi:CRP-like cAMP-binding protein